MPLKSLHGCRSLAEGVQDILIVAVTAAVFVFGWWKTSPIKVYEHTPKADIVHTEQFDHKGLV